jgi:PAS domain S-box-containing protein
MSTAKAVTDSDWFVAGVASTCNSYSTHTTQFYSEDTFLIEAVARFIGGPISAGDAAVIIATKTHQRELEQHLHQMGVNLDVAVEQGRCLFLDAAEALSQFMLNEMPQRDRFVELIGGIVDRVRAAAGGQDRRVVAFGEMVALLWAEGNVAAAIELERLWNELAWTHRFHLRCAYPIKAFDKPEHAGDFLKICSEHGGIYPAEGYTRTMNEDERLRVIAQLQQKAEALEGEIARRAKAEQALREREAELRDFLENAVLPMHWVAADGTILWANKAEVDLLGCSREEYVGHSIREFHVDDATIEDMLQRLSRGEELHGYEARLRHKDGSFRNVRIHSSALVRDGQFVHTRCFIVDVTGEKTAEKTAEGAQLLLAAMVASCDDGIASKDLNGVVTSWNAAAERIFGYKADEIIGRPITLIIPPELQDDENRILAQIRSGKRIDHFETIRVTKDGRRLDVSLTVSPIKDASGKVIGAAKVVRDITERKRSEEALRRAEKLATTGRLAATIAHEINNPMQALSNLLSLVSYKLSLDDNTRQLISMAETELGRMSHITRQMLSFYRESATPTAVKITEVLDDVLELFVMRMRSNRITLERRYECAGDIHGFPVELSQLFANLIGNAIEAVGDKGHIYVHLAPHREINQPHRQGVRVVIGDNGPGIKPELRRHIFEPFFTTKAAKGTGLGLWVVRGIVSKHQGSIRMRSTTNPGRSGTVFSVFLPLETHLEGIAEEPAAATSAISASQL